MAIILVFVGVYLAFSVLPVVFSQFCRDVRQKETARVSSSRFG